ncbi:DNA adenine methylase [Bradyrhizobium sp. WSM471]|uniref:DNA adenine methylase n=1 Tax=Bradyrhizobium sp. WSM471 TaxID=319017 RepID=UPI00024D1BE5|nr:MULTISPECIES: DNA adenine methylase [Bradyrhizobium]EHR00085.1 adenine-specific DNA methylase [Bradyrhizobium sp. WSM471]UFW42212.1 DNA adenine methylase [Bradyrhizobium canariense]
MKYMGSKRSMLRNGLGTLLDREVPKATRFVDLFAGSAAVASHVAQRFDIEVVATDLQTYSVILANAIVSRKRTFDPQRLWDNWFRRASEFSKQHQSTPCLPATVSKRIVRSQREWCERQALPITSAYGGHYFCAAQAVWIDALRNTLPGDRNRRCVALAALIRAASHCAASPGHTAQPFQPTITAIRFLEEAWRRDVVGQTKKELIELATLSAQRVGHAKKIDANLMALQLQAGDLVFIDPPYSGVHYSRFYHVLETIARGERIEVSGVGRYPPERQRPRSRYSVQSESENAFDDLLGAIAKKRAAVIVTFPDHSCSNGLSGDQVKKIAARHFKVRKKSVASHFSTLGGTSDNRGNKAGRNARRPARELILHLTPR